MSNDKKKIFAISGSTRVDSVNAHILNAIAAMYQEKAEFTIYTKIDQLPHFNPDLDNENPPKSVEDFRKHIHDADGVLMCTPEYVFSLPGSFKNAIEWTVSTVLFTDKSVALITASTSGQKAHESLDLIMSTVGAKNGGSLLIQAPKTKVSIEGEITDKSTLSSIQQLMDTFIGILSKN